MKSILGISITFHVAVFCTTLLIGSQRGMLHVPATEPVVLEMHLVATPHVLQATKNAMPEVRKSMQTTATQPLENAPPKPELPTAAISSKLPSVDAIETGNSGNGRLLSRPEPINCPGLLPVLLPNIRGKRAGRDGSDASACMC